MEAVKFKTRLETQTFWKKRVQEWWTSGLLQAEFCEQAGLNICTFKSHSRRYKRNQQDETGLRLIEVSHSAPAPVEYEQDVQTPVSTHPNTTSPLRVHRNGFTFELESRTDLNLLLKVLDALEDR